MSEEERNCPECGRPVAMKGKATCAYCGAALPWAEATDGESVPEGPRDEETDKLLRGDAEEWGSTRASYPVACGACGEKLPDTEPERCPRCHTAVRDPFTGRLVHEEDDTESRARRIKLVVLVLATLLFCAILLIISYLLREMAGRTGYRGGSRPQPASRSH